MMDLMMNMPGAMDGPMGGWDAGFWWPFILVRLLLWGVFLSLLVWFAVRMFSRGRGDISAEEYEKSMRTMRETPPQKDYEDYVREAEEGLRSERDTDA